MSNDLLIAAHAYALKAILITNTLKEFERIEGLSIVNGCDDAYSANQ